MIQQSILLKVFFVFLTSFSFSSYGKKIFKAPYVNFDIGDNWVCKSFGVDWVCYNYLNEGAKPSLILITAKEGISSDNTDLYIKAFDEEKTSSSQKIHVKKISINHNVWAESFYKNNLLKNMFSRYVATVCCDKTEAKIHILIGFHAHKENYTKYANEFLQSIKSLRLSKDLEKTLAQIRSQTDQQKKDMLSYIEKILFESDLDEGIDAQTNKSSNFLFTAFSFLLLAIFAFLLFYFFYYRKLKGKKRRKFYKR